MPELIQRNKRRSVALIAGIVGVLTVLGAAVGLAAGSAPIGALVGLLASGMFVTACYLQADTRALNAAAAKAADPTRYQRLHNIVEGLCVASGLPKPGVYVVDDPALNAFAVGRDPKHAAIAVTTGLLEQLDRVELEGVIAHELSHIRNYDTSVGALAASLIGFLSRGFAPLHARIMKAVVAQERETFADIAACQLTRFPPGLISAFEKLRLDGGVVASATVATAHLWTVQPLSQGGPSDTHPLLEDRIALLREL